jgi:hypothetical protein
MAFGFLEELVRIMSAQCLGAQKMGIRFSLDMDPLVSPSCASLSALIFRQSRKQMLPFVFRTEISYFFEFGDSPLGEGWCGRKTGDPCRSPEEEAQGFCPSRGY